MFFSFPWAYLPEIQYYNFSKILKVPRPMKKYLLLCCLWSIGTLAAQCPDVLPGGHAHNDYAKFFRPKLHRALDLGFASIEVDIYPQKGKLRVSHIPLFLNWKGSFEQLYLAPAVARYQNEGCFFASDEPLILMIDIKRSAGEAYKQLHALCQCYKSYIQHYDTTKQQWTEGPIRLLLSGKVPRELFRADAAHWMQIDGRLSDLPLKEEELPYFGRISQRWPFGKELDAGEKEQLQVWLAQAGELPLRFWALPQSPRLWAELAALGFELYHVDRLKRYSKWRRQQ